MRPVDFLILLLDTGCMNASQPVATAANSSQDWQKTQFANLIRYIPSKTYYARLRVAGKLIRKSLKTKAISVAKLRLGDLEKHERKLAEHGRPSDNGVLFSDAVATYRACGFRPVNPRNKKDAKRLKPASITYYEQRVAALLASWPGLHLVEIRKIKADDCKNWGDKMRKQMSATSFNHTLGILRNIIDFGIKAGARYDNPAKEIMREEETGKALELPSPDKFNALVNELDNGSSRDSHACADLVKFMAFGGFRKGEAKFITWADCDMERKQITVRGHPETGLKNRKPGEVRRVPMINEMKQLLERLRAERPQAKNSDNVMAVNECQKSLDRACKKLEISRLTHHDLRHLFATRCIESGVDVPTVSRWLGHSDGGALAMKVYGHLRDHHSVAMAQKVSFSSPPASVGDQSKKAD